MPSVIHHSNDMSQSVTSPPQSTGRKAKDLVVYRQHNRLQPILRLCPDILEYIFLLGTSFEQDARFLRRTIISYSQTCHDWRVVALSVKRLWSQLVDFDGRSVEWNQELLRRSSPLPIHVAFQVKPSRFEDARKLQFQLDYLERFQSYSIVCPDNTWDILLSRFQRPAPQLETLCVVYNPNHTLSNINPVRLLDTLFQGYAPRLRRLEMTECIIDFTSPIIRNLTTLHVVDLSLVEAPTASEWLQYLRLMPALTKLSLEGAISSIRDQPSTSSASNNNNLDDDEHFQLPCIEDLQLDASTEDVSMMVESLPMPTLCRWSLLCADAHLGPALNSIIDTFNRGIRVSYADSEPCPLSLAVNNSDIYLMSQAQSVIGRKPPVSLYVNLHCRDVNVIQLLFPALMMAIEESIPKITALELSVPCIHPSLISLLSRATRLETLLRLRGSITNTLFPEIQHIASTSPTNAVVLPALENIIFTDDNSMWRQNYQHLVEFIKWRSEQGSPIRNIFFTDCWILEEKVRELRELGVQVQGGQDDMKWWNL